MCPMPMASNILKFWRGEEGRGKVKWGRKGNRKTTWEREEERKGGEAPPNRNFWICYCNNLTQCVRLFPAGIVALFLLSTSSSNVNGFSKFFY